MGYSGVEKLRPVDNKTGTLIEGNDLDLGIEYGLFNATRCRFQDQTLQEGTTDSPTAVRWENRQPANVSILKESSRAYRTCGV